MPAADRSDSQLDTGAAESGAAPTPHEGGAGDTLDAALFEPLDRLATLLLELDRDPATVVTSVRVPRPLREALGLAVELGHERSVSDALVSAARRRLDHLVQDLAFEEYYRRYPENRPTLADLALAAAELADDPLKDKPELLAEVAEWLLRRQTDVGPEDVLMAAAGVEHERMSA